MILDLDGTLTDPAPGFVKCIRYSLEALDLDLPPDARISSHIGPPLEETLSELIGTKQQHRLPDAVRLYRERYSSVGLFENSVYEGIRESLENIYSSDSKIYLATAKPRIFAARILEHFELMQFFSGVYGSELDGTYSDKRQLLKHLMGQESLNINESIMVGDRSHDIAAALANGVRPLGVLWGYGTSKELKHAGAKVLIHEPNELPAAVVI